MACERGKIIRLLLPKEQDIHLSCAVSVGWTSLIKERVRRRPFPCRRGCRTTRILPSFTTEAVLCEPDEPSTVLLQCRQEPWILKFELVLEAVAKISDNAYVIFHFLLDRVFFSVVPSSLSINQPVVVIIDCICSQVQPIVNWIDVIPICFLWAVCQLGLCYIRGRCKWLEEGCDQNGKVQFRVTSRKKRGLTGQNCWTRCLHNRNRLTTNCGQVQTNRLMSGRYFSFISIVICVFIALIHSNLKSFLHFGSSRNRPMSFNITASFW